MTDALNHLDATAQAELVATGAISPQELVEAAIERIERHNPTLNAVVTPLFDKARAVAGGTLPPGPFRGVPVLMKDLGAMTAGDPFWCGSASLRQLGFVAPIDSFLTQKLRASGAVIVGKSNTPEFGILPTTEPAAFGPTRNPYDLSRSPGGSSGGSAAAVATGLVPIAHANDGGGSIRIPASCCGLVGLKPSRGRTSLGPTRGHGGGLVAEHVVTRSVRDSAAMLDVLSGYMPGDPYAAPTPTRRFVDEVGRTPAPLRVGTNTRHLAPDGSIIEAHDDCIRAVDSAAARLRDLGHTTQPTRCLALENPDYIRHFITIWAANVAARLDGLQELVHTTMSAESLEPLTWQLAEMGRGISASTFMRAWSWLEVNTRQAAALWQDIDIYVTPTVSEPPPTLGTFDSSPQNPLETLFRGARFAAFTPPFNASGQPAISLPLHRNAAGLPIGVQLVAAYGREDLLIQLAAQLEAQQPFQHATGWE